MDDIIQLFKNNKLKITPQRLCIYNYLSGTTSHPSADMIYEVVVKNFPTISLATVYKTLKTFTECNIIQEINVGEGNFRYDANIKQHPHIQCLSCGRVDDLHGVDLSHINELAERNSNYKIISNQIYFYGYCENCK